VTISLAQIKEIRSELDAAVAALSELSSALMRLYGQVAALSADDVVPPSSPPEIARCEPGTVRWAGTVRVRWTP
jgi:hypothetical protein